MLSLKNLRSVLALPLLRGSLRKGIPGRVSEWGCHYKAQIRLANDVQEKLEMINVKQTFILPLRAAHLHEWLCNSHNVSASFQHLMAGSTHKLLNSCKHVYLHSGLNASSSFVAIARSLLFLRQVLQSLCLPALHHCRLKGSFFPSELISSRDMSQQARELTTLPGQSTQRYPSAVMQPLLVQESARIFISPLRQVATNHAALLVSWI